ncbi:MAG: hypothetical protein WCA38_08370 [Candidatus Acidiferrales bacterium]
MEIVSADRQKNLKEAKVRWYFVSDLCVLFFVLAQTFQACCYWFWIPSASSPQVQLLAYHLRIDQVRARMVMASILSRIVPYRVIALTGSKNAPLASLLGLIFGAAFVGFEVSARSIDFFVVGQHWAHHLGRHWCHRW